MRERVKIFLVVDLYKWCILNYLCVVVVVVGTREFHNWVVFNFVYIYLEEARDERERCARRFCVGSWDVAIYFIVVR